jgi:hypothetical protein
MSRGIIASSLGAHKAQRIIGLWEESMFSEKLRMKSGVFPQTV